MWLVKGYEEMWGAEDEQEHGGEGQNREGSQCTDSQAWHLSLACEMGAAA